MTFHKIVDVSCFHGRSEKMFIKSNICASFTFTVNYTDLIEIRNQQEERNFSALSLKTYHDKLAGNFLGSVLSALLVISHHYWKCVLQREDHSSALTGI